jgi:aminoglycoside phosphotransferase (APT) family kinase protein
VIDFETCGVGDPACEMFPAWYLLPAHVRDEFRAALDVDDATWLRGRGRVLSQALAICGTSGTPTRRSRTTRGTLSAKCSQLLRELTWTADGC